MDAAHHVDDPGFLKLAEQTEQDTTVVPPDQQLEAGPPLGNTETSALELPTLGDPAQRPLLLTDSVLCDVGRPEAALPDAPPAAENFPYPAEYAFKPEDSAPAHHSTPPAAAADSVPIQQEIQSFPYPAEYAYHADDGSHQHAADGSVVTPLEEEEDLPPPGMAGVRPPPLDAPVVEPAAAEGADAPPAVTSATFTLEGEKKTQLTPPAWEWEAVLPERLYEAIQSARVASRPARALMWEVLDIYGQCWAYMKEAVFPSPLTPAQGEPSNGRESQPAQQQRGEAKESEEEPLPSHPQPNNHTPSLHTVNSHPSPSAVPLLSLLSSLQLLRRPERPVEPLKPR